MDIRVGQSRIHGRGVFARRRFRKNDIIEVCPVILFSESFYEQHAETELYGMLYIWDEGVYALALGYGTLYNHSILPKAEAIVDESNKTIVMVAKTVIETGDEITISYTSDPEDLWF